MGKILPPLLVEEAETQTKYKYVFGEQHQSMATGEMNLGAVLK